MSSEKFRLNKILHLLGAYFSYILFAFFAMGFINGGLWHLTPFLFVTFIVPLMDLLVPLDTNNFKKHDFNSIQTLLFLFAPIGYVIGHLVVLYNYFYIADSLTIMELIFVVLSLGVSASLTITASHELIHKRNSKPRLLFARIGLIHMCYSHFEYSHVFAHHKNAATHLDNNTSWLNESVYKYIFRTIPASFSAGWAYKKKRTKKIFLGLPLNKLTLFILLNILLLIIIWNTFGYLALIIFLAQTLFGVISLEIVSYIEHYGLKRKQKNGKYEATNIVHSWDSYHKFSNYLAFMLPRHADHHSVSLKEYYLLESNNQSPALPFGYQTMIVVALIPSLWKKLTHTKLLKII